MQRADHGSAEFDGRLIIHIGPHKTGTTSIQNYLHDNYSFLANKGILYPEAGREPNIPSLHWEFGRAILEDDRDYLARFRSKLAAETGKHNPRTIILSSEVLGRETVSSTHLRRVAELFPRARRRWCLLLRRQDRLLASLYSEHVKRGLLSHPDGPENISGPEYLDHLRRIRILASAAPGDPILVGSFEKMKSDLIGTFFSMLGLQEAYVPQRVRQEQLNPSLAPATLGLLHRANAMPRRLARPARWIVRSLDRFQRRTGNGALGKELQDRVLGNYRQNNSLIEKRFFAGRATGLPTLESYVSSPELEAECLELGKTVRGWLPEDCPESHSRQ